MKRISTLLLAFLLIFTLITPTEVSAEEKTIPGTYYGKVTRVVDGNSFELHSLDGQDLSVKIAGINTSVNPDALGLTKAFLLGKNIKIEILTTPSSNLQPFYYAIVYMNNIDIAKMYLQSGICKVNYNTMPTGYERVYSAYQNDAYYYSEGIWR